MKKRAMEAYSIYQDVVTLGRKLKYYLTELHRLIETDTDKNNQKSSEKVTITTEREK